MTLTPYERYLVWKEQNQDIMAVFEKYAVRFIERGQRFSFRDLMSHIRWNEYFEGWRSSPYKLCNTHSPYIARDMIRKYPRLERLVRTKPTQEESLAVYN